MGKRKHKETDSDELHAKIRRLERRIEQWDRHRRRPQAVEYRARDNEVRNYYGSDKSSGASYAKSDFGNYSDLEILDSEDERSSIISGNFDNNPKQDDQPTDTQADPIRSNDTQTSTSNPDKRDEEKTNEAQIPVISTDILEALGESKEKDEIFGPKIVEEVSKRWGKIITERLSKEKRRTLLESIHVPENFQLLKAPKLNPEIAAVCSDPGRKRDMRLEKAQGYLGVGIAAITNLMSTLIEKDIERTENIKKLSEAGQVLLDLHFQNTQSRRKLTSYCLGRKFPHIVQNVKRDSFLFGENLGEKIKASKTAEKSGLQIKAPETQTSTSSRMPFHNRQGNSRAAPRQRPPPRDRTGAQTNRYPTQTSRTQRRTNDRYTTSRNNHGKPTRKPQ